MWVVDLAELHVELRIHASVRGTHSTCRAPLGAPLHCIVALLSSPTLCTCIRTYLSHTWKWNSTCGFHSWNGLSVDFHS